MNSFISKLRLKGMAEEDIYFAKLDKELIDALRKKKREKAATSECKTKEVMEREDIESD